MYELCMYRMRDTGVTVALVALLHISIDRGRVAQLSHILLIFQPHLPSPSPNVASTHHTFSIG